MFCFFREFENVLKAMKWGQKEQDPLNYKPSTDNISKAQLLAEYLFLVLNDNIKLFIYILFKILLLFVVKISC